MSLTLCRTFRCLLFALAVLALLGACAQDLPAQHFRLNAFGSPLELEIIGVDRGTAEAVRDQLSEDFKMMQKLWHAWEPGPIARVNRYFNEGHQLAAPPSVLPLIEVAQQLAEQSGYLFEPAIGQLNGLWGFQNAQLSPHAPPDADSIEFWTAQKPSISDVQIDGFHLSSSNTAVRLDFAAMIKGYAIDQAIQRLKEMGITSAVVNLDGNVRAIGSRAGNPWRLAVRDPIGGGVFALIPATGNAAVFSAGMQQRNFTWEGEFYHDILDPRSGYPASGTRSVTVLHTSATTADAAATALFIAGPQDWHEVAQAMGIKYVLLIDDLGRVHMNPAMRDRVQLQNKDLTLVISEPL